MPKILGNNKIQHYGGFRKPRENDSLVEMDVKMILVQAERKKSHHSSHYILLTGHLNFTGQKEKFPTEGNVHDRAKISILVQEILLYHTCFLQREISLFVLCLR